LTTLSTLYTLQQRPSCYFNYLKNNKTILLISFKTIIAICCDNHTEHTNATCGKIQSLSLFIAGGAYCHCAVRRSTPSCNKVPHSL